MYRTFMGNYSVAEGAAWACGQTIKTTFTLLIYMRISLLRRHGLAEE